MKKSLLFSLLLCQLSSCDNKDESTDPAVGNLPAIPIPASVNDLPPSQSDQITVGLSKPLAEFKPFCTELRRFTIADSPAVWQIVNAYTQLVTGDSILKNSVIVDTAGFPFVSAKPRIKHSRYWQRINLKIIDYPADYSETKTHSYGSSRSSSESQEFSQTIGVSATVSAGWGPVSASVTASYENTSTSSQTNSVTFDESTEFSETYSVGSIEGKTIVYAVWQLVDVFSLSDSLGIRIDSSATLTNVKLHPIPSIEFPSKNVIRQSVTKFDAP